MGTKIKGHSPKNARIRIDYSKNKPKVTFSYPSKENQIQGSMYPVVAVLWMTMCFLVFTGLLIAGVESFGDLLEKDDAGYKRYN